PRRVRCNSRSIRPPGHAFRWRSRSMTCAGGSCGCSIGRVRSHPTPLRLRGMAAIEPVSSCQTASTWRDCAVGGATMRPRSPSCASLVAALVLGASPALADWLPEVPITTAGIETEIGLNHTPLSYDSEGGLTVAWAQRDTPNQNFQIYARQRAWSVFTPAAL